MTALDLARSFYRLNNDVPAGRATIPELRALLADDFVFTGPLMQVRGADAFMGMLGQFMPFHESVTVTKQFAGVDEVCSITRLTLKTPAGGRLEVDVAEVLRVADGKVAALTIYYDPRGFAAAFPMP